MITPRSKPHSDRFQYFIDRGMEEKSQLRAVPDRKIEK